MKSQLSNRSVLIIFGDGLIAASDDWRVDANNVTVLPCRAMMCARVVGHDD